MQTNSIILDVQTYENLKDKITSRDYQIDKLNEEVNRLTEVIKKDRVVVLAHNNNYIYAMKDSDFYELFSKIEDKIKYYEGLSWWKRVFSKKYDCWTKLK